MDKHLIKELKYLQYGFISMDAIPASLIAMDCFVLIAVLAFIRFYHVCIYTHVHDLLFYKFSLKYYQTLYYLSLNIKPHLAVFAIT